MMLNSPSHFDLPSDLWPQILSTLPVKSLLRFRCVSKSFLSLIDDPAFSRLHLKNLKNNRDETHLLAFNEIEGNCILHCSNTFEPNSEALCYLGFENFPVRLEIIGSVDGLILLQLCSIYFLVSVLKIWNPSIRKFRVLPSLPEIERSPDSFFWDHDVGLGYDPAANDYKHVKLIFEGDNTLHSVAIYSLAKDSWKITKFRGKGSSCSNPHWKSDISRRGIYFQGSLYFIGNHIDNGHLSENLISFDLSSEMLSSVRLPDTNYWSHWFHSKKIGLIDDGCSLAHFSIAHCNAAHALDHSVWVLESEMNWSKRCSFRLEYTQFLYIKKNGDILMERSRRENQTDEDSWFEVVSCNPKTDECKILQKRKYSPCTEFHICGYVESLISC